MRQQLGYVDTMWHGQLELEQRWRVHERCIWLSAAEQRGLRLDLGLVNSVIVGFSGGVRLLTMLSNFV